MNVLGFRRTIKQFLSQACSLSANQPLRKLRSHVSDSTVKNLDIALCPLEFWWYGFLSLGIPLGFVDCDGQEYLVAYIG
jgi:hypothetical protein